MNPKDAVTKLLEKNPFLTSLSTGQKISVAILLLLCIATSYVVSFKTEEDELRKLDDTATNKLNVYLAFLGSEMKKYRLLSKMIARQETVEQYFEGNSIKNPEDRHLNDFLAANNETLGSQIVFLLNTNGDVVASSNWYATDTLSGSNHSFRPYFTGAINGHSSHYLASGIRTKIPGLFFASPVIFNGKVAGVLVIKIKPGILRPHWHIDDDNLLITDRNGVIFISSAPGAEFRSFQPDKQNDAGIESSFEKQSGESINPVQFERTIVHDRHTVLAIKEPFQSDRSHDYVLLTKVLSEYGWSAHVLSETHGVGLLKVLYSSLAVAVLILLFLFSFYIYQRKTYLQRMYEFAIRDPLTGLFTRLYMNQKVPELIRRAQNNRKESLSLAMFDIDHFKSINDTHGHGAGDSALASVAAVLLCEQGKDIIGVRYGGEEFILFMRLPLDKAEAVAESVRKKVQDMDIVTGGIRLKLTISSGVALYKDNETSISLIERADKLLYLAKNSGRNLVITEENKDNFSERDVAG